MLETIPDPDRQSRALFLVLAVFGIVLLVLAWVQLT
jgi:hypothetical protein